MAVDIRAPLDSSGLTVYALLRTAAELYFDPADDTFKAFVSLATHDLPLTALTNESFVYERTIVDTNFGGAVARFEWVVYEQLGGAPAATDPTKTSGVIEWDGTQEVLLGDIGGGVGATPAAIADAVWNELRAGHTVVGSFGVLPSVNFADDDFTQNADGLPTSFTRYFYDTAANATTHDKVAGLLFSITMSGLSWSNGAPVGPVKFTRN